MTYLAYIAIYTNTLGYEREAEWSIKLLSDAAPWMYFGYSEALKDNWNLDRAGFIESVDQHRKEASRTHGDSQVAPQAACARPL